MPMTEGGTRQPVSVDDPKIGGMFYIALEGPTMHF
jgi:hypothetical protein